MILAVFLLLIATVAADVRKRPYVDDLIRKNLCYSGPTAPTTTPTVSVFDTKSQLSNANGLLQTAFCNSLQLGTLTFGDERLVGTPTCETSGFTTTVNIYTTPKNAANGTPATHLVTCKFNVQVDRNCPSSSSGSSGSGSGSSWGSGDNDNRWGWGNKKRVDNLPCSTRRSRNACTAECTTENFLLECSCLFDNRLNMSQDATCPDGKVCCWNMPCEKWDDTSSFECLRGGGSLDGVTPANCKWTPQEGGGTCSCAAPLVNAGYSLDDLATSLNSTLVAPFDCLCPFIPTSVWLDAGGTGVCAPAMAAPISIVHQASLSLGLFIESLNVAQYSANCKPCSIKIGGNKFGWKLAEVLCNAFMKVIRNDQTSCLTQKIKYGCGIVASQSQCPSLLTKWNKIVGEDQLDQVPVEVLMDVDDVAASSGSVATLSVVAVLLSAVARFL